MKIFLKMNKNFIIFLLLVTILTIVEDVLLGIFCVNSEIFMLLNDCFNVIISMLIGYLLGIRRDRKSEKMLLID